MNELSPFSISLQVHLLRHFDNISNDYLLELAALSGFSIKDLRLQTQLPASKFNSDFAIDPLDLQKRLTYSTAHWQLLKETPEKQDFIISYTTTAWPNAIGTDHVVSISDLSESEISSLTQQRRLGLNIQTLQTTNFPLTWQLICIVSSKDGVLTVFPGKWLPPLNETNINEYVFLISK